MYLDCKFGLSLLLSEITLLFDLSLYLDRTLVQRKPKSEVKVTQCIVTIWCDQISTCILCPYPSL